MDNASFHKSLKTKELIEQAGHRLLYLPPYSPDFNPIEKKWANLKQAIRSEQPDQQNFYETLDKQFVRMSSWERG